MALTKVDLADVVARNSAFAGDHAHQIADLHAIPRSDRHEETRHAAGGGPGSIAIRRSWLSGWSSILSCRASLGTFALEEKERRGGELRGVELLEERLECDDLARRNTAIQHRPQLLSHHCLPIVSPALGTGEIQGSEPSTRQLSEPGNFSRSRQYDDLNRLCLSGALELGGRNRGLEKNYRVCGATEIIPRYANVRVVIVITEGAQSLLSALGGRCVTRHDYRRGRVEVVEEASERSGPGAGADRDVAYDRQLVILGRLGNFDFRRTYLPRPASISLDQVLDGWSDFAHHDDPARVAKLAEQPLESGNGLWSFLEYVVGPGEDDCFDGIDFEKRRTDEAAQLCGGAGNREYGARIEDPGGAGRARDWNDFDSGGTRKPQHGLRNRQGSFRIASYYHDLGTSRRGIDTRQDRSEKFRNRLGRVRKGVNQILGASCLSGRALSDFLRFQHPQPLFCNVA
jgi:hypothetical protein